MRDALPARSRGATGPLDRLADSVVALGTNIYATFATRIAAVAFAIYVAVVAVAVVVIPDPNWDMLPYLAVAQERTLPDPVVLHAQIYGEVEASVSETEFAMLTTSDPYRARMAEDAAAFHSM